MCILVHIKRSFNMDISSYFRVAEEQMELKKIHQKYLETRNELNSILSNYELAISLLKPEFKACKLIDSNVCVFSSEDNFWHILRRSHLKNYLNTEIEYRPVSTYPEDYDEHYWDDDNAFNNEHTSDSGHVIVFNDEEDIDEEELKNAICDNEEYIDYDPDVLDNLAEELRTDSGCYFESDDTDEKIRIFKRLTSEEKTEACKCIQKYLNLQEKLHDYNQQLHFPVQPVNHIYKKNYPPECAVKFLYDLTSGDSKVFRDIATLSYFLQNPEINNVPFVIHSNNSLFTVLIEFLRILTYNKILENKFSYLTKKDNLINIQLCNLNDSYRAFVFFDDTVSDSEIKRNTINNLMNGKAFSIYHENYPLNISIKNHIRMIYFTDKYSNFKKIHNIFSAQRLKIDAKNVKMHIITPEANVWYTRELALIGEFILNKKDKDISKPRNITDDDIIKHFIKKVCTVGKDYECTKDELHKAYCIFFEKYYGDKPLGKNKFSKTIAIIKNLESTRPHHSRKSNPRCFKGIQIDKSKLDSLEEETEPESSKCTLEEFNEYLKEYIDELNEDFVELAKKGIFIDAE